MPAPLAPILARIGAALFGRAAAAQAGTRAGAGIANAGASLAERASVLKKADTLMGRAAVASRLGKDPLDVGLKERVAASEQRIRANRPPAAPPGKTEAFSQEGKTLATVFKRMSLGGFALVFGFKKLLDAVDGLATGILEKQRELAPFSGQIANAFAKLELRTRIIQVKKAEAVGGSTALLADAIGDLREEIAPIRQDFTTLMNLLAVALAKSAQGLAFLAKWDPIMSGFSAWMKLFEGKLSTEGGPEFFNFIAGIERGGFARDHKQPLRREQDVTDQEKQDAQARAGIATDQARKEREKAHNRRRAQRIAEIEGRAIRGK